MPPWAAMEWARRGESWKVKALTLYPSWAREAAAAAPARPVPTTMMSNFRLLFGFTTFMANLWFCQRVSIGPVGDFESSVMSLMAAPGGGGARRLGGGGACGRGSRGQAHDAGQHGDREREVEADDHRGEADGEVPAGGVERRAVGAEALEE